MKTRRKSSKGVKFVKYKHDPNYKMTFKDYLGFLIGRCPECGENFMKEKFHKK